MKRIFGLLLALVMLVAFGADEDNPVLVAGHLSRRRTGRLYVPLLFCAASIENLDMAYMYILK